MGKYSSDSDYEKRSGKKHKSSSRKRSSSSDSSDSRPTRKKDRRSDRCRSKSRSRDRHSKPRRSRSRSDSHHRSHKLKSKRSASRDRSKLKRSDCRDHHRRSRSRDKYRSHRSRSRSYIREFISKPKRRSSSSGWSSSDSSSSGGHKGRIPKKSNSNSVSVAKRVADHSDEMPSIDRKLLDDINSDSFVQKQFASSGKKVPDNIVIDLKKQTIKIPEVEPSEPDSIFHHNLFLNEETRIEKWVRELYTYRQKALQQGLKTN